MSDTIKIGNATINRGVFPDMSLWWEVEKLSNPYAPSFPNDDANALSNERPISYSVWSNFCKTIGLHQMQYDDYGIARSGYRGITIDMTDTVSKALEAYREKAILPPGFGNKTDDDPIYDPHLARLIWFEWWVRWSVNNFEIPAIQII